LVDEIIDRLHEARNAKLPHIEKRRAMVGIEDDEGKQYIKTGTELARIRRIDRRFIGEKLIEKSLKCLKQKRDRWFASIPGNRKGPTFVFLVSTNEREDRVKRLEVLAIAAKLRNNANVVIGIATEPVTSERISIDAFTIEGDPENDGRTIPPKLIEQAPKLFGSECRPTVTEFGEPDYPGDPQGGPHA
jgi:hypothetical protein